MRQFESYQLCSYGRKLGIYLLRGSHRGIMPGYSCHFWVERSTGAEVLALTRALREL